MHRWQTSNSQNVPNTHGSLYGLGDHSFEYTLPEIQFLTQRFGRKPRCKIGLEMSKSVPFLPQRRNKLDGKSHQNL